MEEKKIKILVVPSDASGVGYYRSIWPHEYIQAHYGDKFDIDIVYMKDFPHNNLANFFQQYDIISYHRSFDKDNKIIDLINFLGIPTVIDLDDHFTLGPDHPLHLTARMEKWAEKTIYHLRNSAYVTTTTPLFANILKKYNPNVHVIPNAIDPNMKQFKQQKYRNKRIRFGIICGSGHLQDIKLLDSLKKLPKSILDKVQFCLCGWDKRGSITIWDPRTKESKTRPILPQESVWAKYEEIITDNYKIVSKEHKDWLLRYEDCDDIFDNEAYRRFVTKDIHNYAKHYEHVDVLLAPLKENDFNKVKSQLKVEECAFTNTAIIASDFGPYQLDIIPYIEKGNTINPQGNGLLVDTSKNHKQWVKYITYIVNHPECLDIMKANLKKDVCEKYSMEKIAKERVALYFDILGKKTNQSPST